MHDGEKTRTCTGTQKTTQNIHDGEKKLTMNRYLANQNKVVTQSVHEGKKNGTQAMGSTIAKVGRDQNGTVPGTMLKI